MSNLAWATLGSLVLLALGGLVIYFLYMREPPEEPIFHIKCKHCRKRIRYRKRQEGHKAICPRCGRALVYPIQQAARS